MDNETAAEHFIPISQRELLSHLIEDGRFSGQDKNNFKRFYEILKSLFHFEFQARADELKETYHIFDPDPSTPPPAGMGIDQEEAMKRFETAFTSLMERANFKPLSKEEFDDALERETPLAVNVEINLNEYSLLHLYSRGKKRMSELVPFLFIFRKKTELEVYDRLVLEVKFVQGRRKRRRKKTTLGMKVDKEKIYLKYFKNVPVADIEMIFPDPRIRMSRIDKLRITMPILIGFALLGAKISAVLGGETSQNVLIAVGIGLGGYVIKSLISYRNTVIKYIKNLTQGLYFKNLDNNSGVFHAVIGEAEEEEVKEAVLAYYFLLTFGGMNNETLDKIVEEWFRGRLNIELDFEVEDALKKLERLGLAKKGENSIYQAIPLPQALQRLDYLWDNYFDFSTPEEMETSKDLAILNANN